MSNAGIFALQLQTGREGQRCSAFWSRAMLALRLQIAMIRVQPRLGHSLNGSSTVNFRHPEQSRPCREVS